MKFLQQQLCCQLFIQRFRGPFPFCFTNFRTRTRSFLFYTSLKILFVFVDASFFQNGKVTDLWHDANPGECSLSDARSVVSELVKKLPAFKKLMEEDESFRTAVTGPVTE